MREIHFLRTVWADRQLAKLAPNNDIKRIGERLGSDDFDVMISTMMGLIQIMNEGYERKLHFDDPSHEINVITTEELENMTEGELIELANKAFADMEEDAETTIEAEPEKKDDLLVSN